MLIIRNISLIFISLIIFSTNNLLADDIKIKTEKGKEIKLYNKSYALIIAASNYWNGWPTLPGVMDDVGYVKSSLEDNGFSVKVIIDPEQADLDKAFRDFITKYGMEPENRLLFYFAGHGHTVKTTYGEELGYIVPVDAANPNVDKSGFLTSAMTMLQIEIYAKMIQSKHALFLFDACFSGSIFAISRAIPENITYKTAKPVRQFITSGGAEETVPDESIFRKQFCDALSGSGDINSDGYITGSELGEFLQGTVINYSKGSQHPQYGKIRNPNLDKGDFVFLVNPSEEESLDIADDYQQQESIPRTFGPKLIPIAKSSSILLGIGFQANVPENEKLTFSSSTGMGGWMNLLFQIGDLPIYAGVNASYVNFPLDEWEEDVWINDEEDYGEFYFGSNYSTFTGLLTLRYQADFKRFKPYVETLAGLYIFSGQTEIWYDDTEDSEDSFGNDIEYDDRVFSYGISTGLLIELFQFSSFSEVLFDFNLSYLTSGESEYYKKNSEILNVDDKQIDYELPKSKKNFFILRLGLSYTF